MNFSKTILLSCLLSAPCTLLMPSQKITGIVKRTVFSSVLLSLTITYVNQVLNGPQDFTELPESPSLEAIRDHMNKWKCTLSNTHRSLHRIYAEQLSDELTSSQIPPEQHSDICTPNFNDIDNKLIKESKESSLRTILATQKNSTHEDPATPTGYDDNTEQ